MTKSLLAGATLALTVAAIACTSNEITPEPTPVASIQRVQPMYSSVAEAPVSSAGNPLLVATGPAGMTSVSVDAAAAMAARENQGGRLLGQSMPAPGAASEAQGALPEGVAAIAPVPDVVATPGAGNLATGGSNLVAPTMPSGTPLTGNRPLVGTTGNASLVGGPTVVLSPQSASGNAVRIDSVDDVQRLGAAAQRQLATGDANVDLGALANDVNRQLGSLGDNVRQLNQSFTVPAVTNAQGTASTGGSSFTNRTRPSTVPPAHGRRRLVTPGSGVSQPVSVPPAGRPRSIRVTTSPTGTPLVTNVPPAQ